MLDSKIFTTIFNSIGEKDVQHILIDDETGKELGTINPTKDKIESILESYKNQKWDSLFLLADSYIKFPIFLEIQGINALSLSTKAKVHPTNVKDSLMEMFKALNKLKEKL